MSGGRVFIPPIDTLPPGVKPVGPVEIDWSHPLARGLVGYFLGGSLENLADNRLGTVIGSSVSTEATAKGEGWAVTGDNTTDRINLGNTSKNNKLGMIGADRMSIIHGAYRANGFTNLYPRIFDKTDGGGGQNGWIWSYNGAINEWQFKINSVTPLRDWGFSYTLPASEEYHTEGVSVYPGTSYLDAHMYHDGVRQTLTTDTALGSRTAFPTTDTNMAIGNWNHTTDREWKYPILFIAIWTRTLTDAEHASMARNPYQFLRSPAPQTAIITDPVTPNDRVWLV